MMARGILEQSTSPEKIAFVDLQLAKFRENLDPESGAYLDAIIRSGEEARSQAKRNRQFQRGQLLRYLSSSPWRLAEWSVRTTAVKIKKLGDGINMERAYLAEPQRTLKKVRELNGGKMPSEETIRKEIS